MSELSQPKPHSLTSVTASFTTLIICATSFIPTDWLTAEAKTALPILAGLVSPYLAAYAMKGFQKINLDPDLISYQTRLESDLARQNKLLKTKNLSEGPRNKLIELRDDTIIRLATAHRDFSSGSLAVSPPSPD
ncbi:hypothetical protein KDX38_28530 [Pseudomonas sp. CDFA 602]|uniref:hypothetical protein n=1 Tax=Pseudomonas californiensis TaxID=2829823 RepID=UPI001E5C7F7C|nr:hypothetical protein [Pseudomonas californiensis]MCD5997494.1 hypothetical protein [Pseudomonas californiensis]MCD6003100.1 hypothetical protein [Pseudomonas californiensis]